MKRSVRLAILGLGAALFSSTATGAVTFGGFANASRPSELLYVANRDHNRIDVYPAGVVHPSRIGVIRQGVHDPYNVATDASGSLYVVNNHPSRITVYAPGQTAPDRTLPIEPHHFARYISVGPDGTVYVETLDRFYRFFVEEFDPGASAPSRIVKIPYYFPYAVNVTGITTDSANDLYVNQGSGNAGGGYAIQVYPPKALSPSYQIALTYGYPSGDIEALGDSRIVVGDPPDRLLIAPLPHPRTFQFRKIVTDGGFGFFTVDLTSNYVYVVGRDGVSIYDFRSGMLLGRVPGTKGFYGVAVGPV